MSPHKIIPINDNLPTLNNNQSNIINHKSHILSHRKLNSFKTNNIIAYINQQDTKVINLTSCNMKTEINTKDPSRLPTIIWIWAANYHSKMTTNLEFKQHIITTVTVMAMTNQNHIIKILMKTNH